MTIPSTSTRRPFTQFEERVNFAVVNDTFDNYESLFISRTVEVIKRQVRRLLLDIRDILDRGDIPALRTVRMEFHDEHAAILQHTMDELSVRVMEISAKEVPGAPETTVLSEFIRQSNAVKADIVAASIEGKILSQAILTVLEGKRRGKSDRDILTQLGLVYG